MHIEWKWRHEREAKYILSSPSDRWVSDICRMIRSEGLALSPFYSMVRSKKYLDTSNLDLWKAGVQLGVDDVKGQSQIEIKYPLEDNGGYRTLREIDVVCENVGEAMKNPIFWLLPPLRRIAKLVSPSTFNAKFDGLLSESTNIVADRKYFWCVDTEAASEHNFEFENTLVFDYVRCYRRDELLKEFYEIELEIEVSSQPNISLLHKLHAALLKSGASLSNHSKYHRSRSLASPVEM